MRIGLFSDAYLPEISGVTTVVQLLKVELEALGHETYVYAPRYRRHRDKEDNVYRFRSQRFLFNKASRVALPYNRQAARTFGKLDIIHSHSPFSMGLLAMMIGLRHYIPHIHTYHTYLSEYRHYLPRLLRIPKKATEDMSAAFCNRCTAVTAPSKPVKRELERYGVRRPIHVLPFGVDFSQFQQPPIWHPRSELGILPDSPFLLHVGRLAKEKNLSFVLRTFKLVHNQIPSSVLAVSGDGPERTRFEAEAKRLLPARSVVFTGFLPMTKLVDVYKTADLLLFASKTETQGLVVLESMAGGTPVVALGEMGVLDIMRDNINGLVAPEDEQQFAQLVTGLLRDESRRSKLVEGAVSTAMELSSRESARRLLALFEEAVNK